MQKHARTLQMLYIYIYIYICSEVRIVKGKRAVDIGQARPKKKKDKGLFLLSCLRDPDRKSIGYVL